MKFVIKRGSQEYRQEKQPSNLAVEIAREHYSHRYSENGSIPPEWEKDWYTFRDGDYWTEYDIVTWEITIDTLDELMSLIAEVGPIVVEKDRITIYDTYLE